MGGGRVGGASALLDLMLYGDGSEPTDRRMELERNVVARASMAQRHSGSPRPRTGEKPPSVAS